MVGKKPWRGDRPFRLVDAMILTAATAVGLAGARSIGEGLGTISYAYTLTTGWDYLAFAETHFVVVGIPLLAAWSAAVVLVRLVPPRPPRRRWGAQPGVTAACATVVALAAVLGTVVACKLATTAPFFEILLTWGLSIPGAVGAAILASWTTLAVGGRWRPEPGWIDRLGRILALAWFANWLAALHLFLLS